MFRVVAFVLFGTLVVAAGSAQAGQLDKLGWMAGHWAATGESHVEEVWTEPRAGSMTGMFRLVNEKKLRVLEYIVVSEEKGGVFYRFKHFRADYDTWEGDGAPLTFKLVNSKKGRAVFKNVTKAENQPAYISYLMADDGTMTVLVGSSPGKADSGETIKFVLSRR